MALNDESYEMILVMRYLDWMKWDDIANRLYISIATVKRRYENALMLLKIS